MSEPEHCSSLLSHLQYVALDGLACCLAELGRLVTGCWARLLEVVQQQVVWLVRQLARLGSPGVEGVVWQLLRQQAGGGRRAVWLAEQLLRLGEEQGQWLVGQPSLLPGYVYCLLRQVEDHSCPQRHTTQQQLDGLRDREATLAVSLIRENSDAVLVLGRDLLRALQHVARCRLLPSFNWSDLYTNFSWLGKLHLVKATLATPASRGAYFSFCGENHPRKNFLCSAGYYFLGRIYFWWGKF